MSHVAMSLPVLIRPPEPRQRLHKLTLRRTHHCVCDFSKSSKLDGSGSAISSTLPSFVA